MGILFFFSCRAEIAFGYTCFFFSFWTAYMVACFIVCVNVLWPSLFDGSVFSSTASLYQRLTMSIFIFFYFLVYCDALCFIILMRAV